MIQHMVTWGWVHADYANVGQNDKHLTNNAFSQFTYAVQCKMLLFTIIQANF
jgi:hypothetical protein